jgi:hypothetical protein
LAGLVFAVFGGGCAALLFWQAPGLWSGTSSAALAAGMPGGLAWWALCSRQRRYSAWRWLAVGLLAGILCHPFYWVISAALSGELLPLGELLAGSELSFMIASVFTVPAGLVAAAACRGMVVMLAD